MRLASASALILLCIGLSLPARAANNYVSTSVTAHMVEDGKVDESRIFIFGFYYSDPQVIEGVQYPAGCTFTALTINNVQCNSKNSMFYSSAPWTKIEFCTKDYCGDKFACQVRAKAPNLVELTVDVPVDAFQITHRVTVQNGNMAVEYSGWFTKYSDILKGPATARYEPIVTSRGLYTDVPLGCSKIAAPSVKNIK